jgi:hypothetical protein
MATIPSITTWSFEQVLTAAALNGNFATIRDAINARGLFTDEARTVSAVLTFSAAPVFSNPQTFADAVTVTSGGLTVTAGGLTVTAGGITATGDSTITGTLGGLTDVTASGTVTAATFAGSGASLTNLPAANITGTLPAISGANLTSLNASNISSGTINAARLPTIPLATAATQVSISAGAQGFFPDGADAAIIKTIGTAAHVDTSAPTGGIQRWLIITIDGVEYSVLATRTAP